jgi:hypothetical protein
LRTSTTSSVLGRVLIRVRMMPSFVPANGAPIRAEETSGVLKFTNCLLVKGNDLVKEDLWVSSVTGKILNGQQILYGHRTAPEEIVDLGGRILSPGLIDTQLNGAYGFDFSIIPEEGTVAYSKGVLRVNRSLVATGVTSYLPTLTSQRREVYQTVLKPPWLEVKRRILTHTRRSSFLAHQVPLAMHLKVPNLSAHIAKDPS